MYVTTHIEIPFPWEECVLIRHLTRPGCILHVHIHVDIRNDVKAFNSAYLTSSVRSCPNMKQSSLITAYIGLQT